MDQRAKFDPAKGTRVPMAVEHTKDGILAARRFHFAGRVQGVGFRPSIARLALELGLTGAARNTPEGVAVEVEGPQDQVDVFEREVFANIPASAQVMKHWVETVPVQHRTEFVIEAVDCESTVAVRVSADRAVCGPCLEEAFAPGNRRSGYAFVSCVDCGPRYSTITTLPYERSRTTFGDFPLCEECGREFHDPLDRRFHAETTACPRCGPEIWLTDNNSRSIARGPEVYPITAKALLSGGIVAFRGIGGYQLLCDATNQEAVQKLREKKGRPVKPLAVMTTLARARTLAEFSAVELETLTSPANPIVLIRRSDKNNLAPSVCGPFSDVGLLLPTTAAHALLLREFGRPLVCTSGNRDGEPLAVEVDEAERELSGIAELFVHHNRPIARPLDDSVVRIICGKVATVRLARGLAPLPLAIDDTVPTLALGGHLKVAAAWSNGSQAVLGPHLGDVTTLANRERHGQLLADCQELYRFRPEVIVHDQHPDYFTSRWAQGRPSVKSRSFYHHYCHVAAALAEVCRLGERVLGVAWDGTGLGPDGTIWGGEFLVVQGAKAQRVGCLRPFRLIGGDSVATQPWRSACAVVWEVTGTKADPGFLGWPGLAGSWEKLTGMLAKGSVGTVTTSAGRLFDAATALILGIDRVTFEGEAPMRLESIADPEAAGAYSFPLIEEQCVQMDWRPAIRELLEDRHRGVGVGVMATRFHRGLANGIAMIARRWQLQVVLAGGTFQNRLLCEMVHGLLLKEGRQVLTPGLVPTNDGGLAAGQLALASLDRS